MRFRTGLMLSCMAAMFLALCNESTAQGPGGPGGRGGMFGGGSLAILGNEKVQQELDLVDSQVQDLKDLQAEMQTAMRDMFEEMRNGGGGGDRQQMFEKMREKMTELTKDFERDIDEILLPDQRSRLKQLVVQMQVRGRGGSGSGLLDNETLKSELKITREQEEKMRAEAEKAQEELRKQIAELQKKAMERVLGVLSAEQREQYKQMVGDDFDFGNDRNAGGRGAWGGGRGGQDRGGQDRGGQDRGGRSDF